jgi:CIC family chloride channel protein
MQQQSGRAPLRVPARLGDYSVNARIVMISALALAVGAVAALVADGLQKLIGLITNLVFYQRVATGLVAPGLGEHHWWLIVGAPVVGGLIVGLMARYGSEAIRGHGMPEAIEAIMRGGSKIRPRVALLKPVSAAISIGTGGALEPVAQLVISGGANDKKMPQTQSLNV